MEKAAVIWETFEALPTPLSPVNIYKASCSIKSAEFLTRIRNNSLFRDIAQLLAAFMNETLEIADGEGTNADRSEGFQAVELIEREMPLTKEIFDDAAAYATRQHVFDGLIMLAAAKMGKAEEAKQCIDNLQKGVARAMVTAVFRAAISEVTDENPDE